MSATAEIADFSSYAADMIQHLPQALIVLNKHGYVEWANPCARNLLGFELDSGVRWAALIDTVFSPREDDGHEVSLVNGRRVSLAISPICAGQKQLIVMQDVTKTRDYQTQQSQMQRLADMGRMTAQLAHQLRTPLASAMLYTENLQNRPNDTKAVHWRARLQECHYSIARQIDDLLLFARGDALSRQPMAWVRFFENLCARIGDLPAAATVRIRCVNRVPEEAVLLLHPESLLGAITNLLRNSFDAGASDIGLSACCVQDNLVLTLEDNGKGMSEDAMTALFKPFFTTKAQGNGLGLCIVRAVVDAHQGTLDIKPVEQGQGVVVCIIFPLLQDSTRRKL